MALDTAVYFVTKEIAIRSGLIDSRYRIADGRFVLDNKDLSRVRFTTDEYISGLAGVEKVDALTAQQLVAQNGYQRGRQAAAEQQPQQQQVEEEEATETVIEPEQEADGDEEIENTNE